MDLLGKNIICIYICVYADLETDRESVCLSYFRAAETTARRSTPSLMPNSDRAVGTRAPSSFQNLELNAYYLESLEILVLASDIYLKQGLGESLGRSESQHTRRSRRATSHSPVLEGPSTRCFRFGVPKPRKPNTANSGLYPESCYGSLCNLRHTPELSIKNGMVFGTTNIKY